MKIYKKLKKSVGKRFKNIRQLSNKENLQNILPANDIVCDHKNMIDLNKLKQNLDYAWYQDFLVMLVQVMQPKTYVELGLAECNLHNRILKLVDKCYGCDMNPDVLKNADDASLIYIGTTDSYSEIMKKNNVAIDFLFIDADHSKDQVRKDFYNFFDLVSDNGIIVFHDTHPKSIEFFSQQQCGDCYEIIMELQKKHLNEIEMITIPVHPGITICRKRTKQLKWQ